MEVLTWLNDRNMKAIINSILLLLCLLVIPASAQRRGGTSGAKLDTLAFGKRLSFHSNMIDWLMGTPNAAVELDLTGKPYNRLALLGNIKYNWNPHHTTNSRIVYNVFELCGEGRYYWHTRSDGFAWKSDTTAFFMKNVWHHFRTRAAVKKRSPRTYRAYYVGLYGEYDKYTLLFGHGVQGKGVGVGVSGGFTQPLYQMRHGSVELEIGGRVGLRYTRFDKFGYEEESACYDYRGTKRKHLVPFPVVQDIHVSLVYRLVSSKNKYKWNRSRADQWDNNWSRSISERAESKRLRADSLKQEREVRNARKKFVADSVASVKREKHVADSLLDIQKKFVADSVKMAKRMNDSIVREAKIQAKQMKKRADRMRKDSIAAAKDSLERMKNIAPAVSEVPIDSVAHTEEISLPEPVEIPLPEVEPEELETPPSETDGENDEKPVPDEPSKDGGEENPAPEEEPAEPEDEQSQDGDIQTPNMRLDRHGMRYEVSEWEEGGQKS